MRKLFFAVYFISIFSLIPQANSGVRDFVSPADVEAASKAKAKNIPEKRNRPKFESRQELYEYMFERMDNAVVTEIPQEELENPGATSVIKADEYVDMMKKDDKKSFFEQVYENAINRVSKQQEQQQRYDIVNIHSNITNTKQQKEQWEKPTFEAVNITLPGGKKLIVPAIEHIPYLMSNIEILPTGMVKINEKIIVVANDEKLKKGLSKSLPKYSYSRTGEKQNLNINLLSVKINGKEFDYKIDEIGNLLLLVPAVEYTLEPGVYTYDFEYIVDKQVAEYGDFREFYWNLTGNNWNLVVARAGVSIQLPSNEKELGHSAFINTGNGLDARSVRMVRLEDDSLGFISARPVFVGESMGFILSIPETSFVPANFDKKLSLLIDDYGDIILSILGLSAIFGGYFVSWMFMTKSKQKSKYSIQRNGAIIRFLMKGYFDKISFGSFLLELYKKNIIDIRQGTLIKLTDKDNFLTKREKEALQELFPNKASSINIDKTNKLKLNRAYNLIEKDTKSRISKFLLKISSGYIIFSIAMLLLTQIGISLMAYNPLYNLTIMIVSDIIIAVCAWLFLKKTKNKILPYVYKTIAIILSLGVYIVLLSIINNFSALAIMASIFIIYYFTNMFSSKNGLIKTTIKDIKNLKDYILNNVENISQPRNFISHQANIFALEIEDKYKEKMQDKDFYKMDIVSQIIKHI